MKLNMNFPFIIIQKPWKVCGTKQIRDTARILPFMGEYACILPQGPIICSSQYFTIFKSVYNDKVDKEFLFL